MIGAIQSAPLVDLAILFALFGSFVIGAMQGAIRRILGILSMVFAFLLAANPGEPLLPLAKVASGGELARAMLALRLVLLGRGEKIGEAAGPGTLVFDEVDAGVGGEAAVAVGRALAELSRQYQVVVVTHLAQVAAFADAQVAVSKVERDGRAVARAEPDAVGGGAHGQSCGTQPSGPGSSKAVSHHTRRKTHG